jgi:hypothetical protein
MKCTTNDCQHPASVYPIVCLPPPLPYSDTLAARLFSMNAVCASCSEKMAIDNFMLPESKAKISEGFASIGRIMPDFDRAWLEWGKVGDDEWQTSHNTLPSVH